MGTADQHIASSWVVNRVRSVADRPGEQARFAGVADTSPTGPPSGYVARLSEVQQAGIARIPVHGEAAAGKADLRTVGRFTLRMVRRAGRGRRHTRRDRRCRAEDLGAYPAGIDAEVP